MKKKSNQPMPFLSIHGRSWALMIVGSLVFLTGLVVVVLACLYFMNFGWLVAILMIIGGLSSMFLSVLAMKDGKPEWLLLDLIIPG